MTDQKKHDDLKEVRILGLPLLQLMALVVLLGVVITVIGYYFFN